MNPIWLLAWTNKDNCMSSLNNHKEALYCHHEALELQPNSYVMWINKANSLSRLKRYDEAIACYDKASEIEL